jgi:two-component system KDP operon response regulator KdpE
METKPEKIVVLDADPRSREDTSAALKTAGYDVAVYATVREALDSIHQNGADLVLIDSTLDVSGAREALATIRGSAKTAAMRVVLLVGEAAEERTAALDLGANDAISRPYDTKELLARVRARLRVQRAENQLRD